MSVLPRPKCALYSYAQHQLDPICARINEILAGPIEAGTPVRVARDGNGYLIHSYLRDEKQKREAFFRDLKAYFCQKITNCKSIVSGTWDGDSGTFAIKLARPDDTITISGKYEYLHAHYRDEGGFVIYLERNPAAPAAKARGWRFWRR